MELFSICLTLYISILNTLHLQRKYSGISFVNQVLKLTSVTLRSSLDLAILVAFEILMWCK